jgi:uncharacterized protein
VSDLPTLDALERQLQVAAAVSHRPWPLPDGPWAQAQTRRDVLFVHWRVALDELARLLPPELPLDTFEGEAWLGVTCFRMEGFRVRGLPPVPGLSSFPQLEVLTYVTLDDRPGVWLFSLEAGKPLIVEAAKRTHRLPAYRAEIAIAEESGGVLFAASRDGLAFKAQYAGAGQPFTAPAGSLERFLVERYAVYTADGGRLYRADLHHAPWLLEAAQATVETATISPVALEGEPYALWSGAQDLLVWPLEEL